MAGTSNSMTVDQVYQDYRERYNGLQKAFTTQCNDFMKSCDPGGKEDLCLFGLPGKTWKVKPPGSYDSELPQPATGIIAKRLGMADEDWLLLVANHSYAWLMALAFYQACTSGFRDNDKKELFEKINKLPTLYERPSPEKTSKLSSSIKEGINSEDFVAQAENKEIAILEHGSGGSSQKRLRGGPPGSKDKQKAPDVITKEKESPSSTALSCQIIQINNGADIAERLATFAQRKRIGLSVLSGSGIVSNMTLRHPKVGEVTREGRFPILSLSGSFLPISSPPGTSGLTIHLEGQDRILGGRVVGPLKALENVIVVAATFTHADVDGKWVASEGGGSGGDGADEVAEGEQSQDENTSSGKFGVWISRN